MVEWADVRRADWCRFVLLMWVVCLKQLPFWPDPLTHTRIVLAPVLLSCPVPLQLQVLADRNQSFVRLLGVELGPEGAPCQRFAGVVDGGILLKLVRLACCVGVGLGVGRGRRERAFPWGAHRHVALQAHMLLRLTLLTAVAVCVLTVTCRKWRRLLLT